MSINNTTQAHSRRGSFSNPALQAGVTLMETMIALALSMLVTSAMVVLMASSMGTSNRITQMTQLTDELRNVMSMMTRDVRRANYSSTAVLCYGNPDCSDHDWSRQLGSANAIGNIIANVDDQCLLFQLDRLGDDMDGDATNDSKGGFRRREIGGVGVIQMWVSAAATAPACGDADGATGWLAVTDPNIVNITAFRLNTDLNTEKSIFQDAGLSSYTQFQRHLGLAIEGELVLEDGMGWDDSDAIKVQRHVEDLIKVRNDYLTPPAPVS